MKRHLAVLAFLGVSSCGLTSCAPDPADRATVDRLYAEPARIADGPASVYFIGHSLVSRDMPAMLAQLAPAGHRYESQLGWGAELEAHWEPDIPLDGADVENAHPRFREAHDAVGSGEYDVLVLTEKIDLQDAIRYHAPWRYLSLWAEKAWEANPETRIYLYETWHPTDIAEGWLVRLDQDLETLWEREIVDRALTETGGERAIHVIPAGQVLARTVREFSAAGGVDGLVSERDFMSDTIHLNDIGAYLVAVTHYAAIYGRSPVGLPFRLKRADGSEADAPGPEAAARIQRIAWEVVTSYPRSGVRAE